MGTRRLQERFAFTGGTVNRTGPYPVIENVLLCGPVSANKRRYLRQAFEGDRVKRYDGKPVFIDHGEGNKARKYRDQLGWVEKPRLREDGMPVGNIAVKPTHPDADSVLFDAEHRPSNCGMSHVANCEAKRAADGWDDVTEVAEVESVDVVIGPATTNGFFEQNGGRTVSTKIALRALIEKVRPKLKEQAAKGARRWLLASEEDDYAGPDMGMEVEEPAEPAEGGEPEDELWAGFHAACVGFLEKYKDGELSADEACKEIGKYVKAHEKLLAGKGPEEVDDEDDDEDDGTPPKEGKKPGKTKKRKTESAKPLDPWAVLAECKAAGLKDPGPGLLKALAHTPDAADRKALIEESLASSKPAQRPTSGGPTPPRKPPTAEQTQDQRAFSAW